MTLYIIQSQSGAYLDKQLAWVSAADASSLFHTPHKDVALNQLIELNTRDINLRATVVPCEVDDRGRPQLASHEAQCQG